MTVATMDSIIHQVTVAGYDITEYILAGSTRKSLREPVGTWTLQLRPTILNNRILNIKDISINSFIEIRLGRNSELINNAQGQMSPPLLMRGLVDSIDITEKVAQGMDGQPERTIMMTGRDLGKTIVSKSVFVPQDNYTAESQKRAVAYTLLSQKLTAKKSPTNTMFQDFKSWITEVLGPIFRDPLMGFDFANNLRFKIDVNMPQLLGADRIKIQSGFTLQGSQGSLFRYIEHYCPPPFMEMFIEDQELESIFKIRWAPFRNAQGLFPYQATDHIKYDQTNYWFDPDRDPQILTISRDKIIASSLRKSGNDRPTYFWCQQGEFTPNGAQSNGASTGANSFVKPLSGNVYANGNRVMNPQYDFEGMKQFGLQPIQIMVPFWPKETTNPSRPGTYIPGSRSPEPTPYKEGETRTREQAVEWAQGWVGRGSSYSMLCERFCENAYGKQNLYYSAWVNASTAGNVNNRNVNNIQIGDLVFFNPSSDNKNFGHIGIYVGQGKMISAESGSATIPADVRISSLLTGYWAGNGADGVKLFHGSGSPEKCFGIVYPAAAVSAPAPATTTFTGYITASSASSGFAQRLVVLSVSSGQKIIPNMIIESSGGDLGTNDLIIKKAGSVDANGVGSWELSKEIGTAQGSSESPLTFTVLYFPGGADVREAQLAAEKQDALMRVQATQARFTAEIYGTFLHVKEMISGNISIGQKINIVGDKDGSLPTGYINRDQVINDTYVVGFAETNNDSQRMGGAGVYVLSKSFDLPNLLTYTGTQAPVLQSELTKPATENTTAVNDSAYKLLDDMTQWLYDVFRETDKKWVGTMELIGTPAVKIGMELIIESANKNLFSSPLNPSEDLSERFYVEGVEHAWQIFPDPAYHTRVSVTRGTNIPETTAGIVGLPEKVGFSRGGVINSSANPYEETASPPPLAVPASRNGDTRPASMQAMTPAD